MESLRLFTNKKSTQKRRLGIPVLSTPAMASFKGTVKRKLNLHENENKAPKLQKVEQFMIPRSNHRHMHRTPKTPCRLLETGKIAVLPAPKVEIFKPTQFKRKELPLPEPADVFLTNRNKVAEKPIKAMRRLPEKSQERVPFKARPPVVLYKNPFEPKLPGNRITKPIPFRLHTEDRAIKRRDFEMRMQQQRLEIENIKLQLLNEKKRQEAQEIKELRKLKFHARPVPDFIYRPTTPPAMPQMPLTTPITPKVLQRGTSKCKPIPKGD